ncbi:MAG: phage holin family protein [Candidatus Accumulibacter sp.]|jgi:uncharacterized membrane protein YqjE|nr:phage holin family protein [Accumulibacter sp.]
MRSVSLLALASCSASWSGAAEFEPFMVGDTKRLDPTEHGLFSSLKVVLSSLLESVGARLELLANEIQEEKLRCVNLALLALGTVFCLGAAGLVGVFFLTVLFWENRAALLGMLGIAFALTGVILAALLRRALTRPRGIFEASLSELREDIRQLKGITDSNGDAE